MTQLKKTERITIMKIYTRVLDFAIQICFPLLIAVNIHGFLFQSYILFFVQLMCLILLDY